MWLVLGHRQEKTLQNNINHQVFIERKLLVNCCIQLIENQNDEHAALLL